MVNRLHRLGDVIVIAICAVMANADGPTAIAHWAKLNAVWLRRHLASHGGMERRFPDVTPYLKRNLVSIGPTLQVG
jgi:hypothetical protein